MFPAPVTASKKSDDWCLEFHPRNLSGSSHLDLINDVHTASLYIPICPWFHVGMPNLDVWLQIQPLITL